MSVRTIKPQVGCVAGLTSISPASAPQGFPDFHTLLPFHLFPISFPIQSCRTRVFLVALLSEHAFATPSALFPRKLGLPSPPRLHHSHELLPSLAGRELRGCGSKNPHFVSTYVSPGDAQASLTQVIAKPQVVYLLRTQHPLLWDWTAKVEENLFSHKHLKQRSNQTWTQSNKY